VSDEREAAVLAAADAIIDNFGHHEPPSTSPASLRMRPSCSTLLSAASTAASSMSNCGGGGREDGFLVHSCASSARRVQLFETMAIFTHDVRSTIEFGAEVETFDERETIVFELRDDRWVAVHEHLSKPSLP